MEKENMESMEAAKTDMEKAISSLEELGYSCSEASDRILSAIECEIRSRRRRIVDSFEKELAKMETSQLHVLAESIKKEVGITK